MQKYIYLNIGLNNLPEREEEIKLRHIMDSLAYAFDNKPFLWAHTWSEYEGQPEPTLIVSFQIDPIQDSTILRYLEGMCTEYNQDSIAFEISQDNETGQYIEPYLQGLAWHPRVRDGHSKYLFNPDYFVRLHDTKEGPQLYTSENVPAASKYNTAALIEKFS